MRKLKEIILKNIVGGVTEAEWIEIGKILGSNYTLRPGFTETEANFGFGELEVTVTADKLKTDGTLIVKFKGDVDGQEIKIKDGQLIL